MTDNVGLLRSRGERVTDGDFRDLMMRYPSGVAVVTTIGADASPRGMTCSSLTSVSIQPPTLLVCLRIGSATLSAIKAGGVFAVNLLHEESKRIAELFAGPDPDRFGQVQWKESPARMPWLAEDVLAAADCEVIQTMRAGDHEVVFGEVSAIMLGTSEPLLYGLRRFARWSGRQDGFE